MKSGNSNYANDVNDHELGNQDNDYDDDDDDYDDDDDDDERQKVIVP